MEKKVHFKLRKVKKRWVTVSVASTVLALTSLSGGFVKADSNEDSNQVVNDSQTGLVTTSKETTKEDSASSGAANTATSEPKVTENNLKNNAATKTADANAAVNAQAAVSQSKSVSDKIVAASPKAANRTAANNKVAAANTAANVRRSVTAKFVPNKPKDIKINQSGLLGRDNVEALNSVKNIKNVNGKYYYYKEDGTVQKNYALNINGKIFYFDETGALSDSSLPKRGSTSDFTDKTSDFAKHNQAYSTAAESFEHINNYLTADSWYRPKSILKDGKTWTESTDKDFRPILMSWWPDQETQRQYVNYMNTQLGINRTYNSSTSQAQLDLAAQTVQTKIEEKITATKNTNWLRSIISSFVKTQTAWNSESEKPFDDHLQKGALLYSNNSKTSPHANSNYRILNRTPTYQTGKHDPRYTADPSMGGYEFLLANDVDNSNPVVQAEQLNWLHFLMNFGKIYANDPDANFDSIRVDAVDNVDADLLQIAGDYLKAAKGIHKNDKNANDHLSILEAWSNNDTPYLHDDGDNMINMDNKLRLSLLYSLAKPLGERSGMNPLITNSLINRTEDSAETAAVPSYSFIRAHDSEVQDLIGRIIRAEINPNVVGYSFTMEEIKKAFEIYNKDLLATNKKYTHYNTALSYALLLTNKSSVPRVYYGDMFTDDGQYMANKTINYDAIEALLKARIKYVSGGQSMSNMRVGNSEIITSVRYGKGALTKNVVGDQTTRLSGVAVIEGNNPNLRLNSYDRVVVNMGAAHKNQAYRPLLLTTNQGIATYNSDQEAAGLVRYTNDRGELIFTAADIKGYANPQVSGYLGVWVPVGAAANQDIRVAASETPSTDGKSVHQNAALDSRVMFEGFSNFQDFATKEDEYTNVVIAKNVDKFAEWGVTDFEMAPQYVSSTDGTFLDSVIQNGYAFTDRYDLGISKPNKYGTADHLVKAIKALHSKGIKVMADWVPDQMYAFPEKEVVEVTRVDKYGRVIAGSQIKNTLYVVDSKSSGKDQQAKYGGEFLKELQEKYPELFTRKQISTGVAMDPTVKIKQWSAKYFNGTNILGRGAGYVLKDQATNTYFSLAADKTFLPKSLLTDRSSTNYTTGFVHDGKGYTYYSTSGNQAKNTFISLGDKWYYFDKDGYMVTGAKFINGANYFFLSNGIQLRNAIYNNGHNVFAYYGNDGRRYENGYYLFGQQWRYFRNGVMAVGLTTVNGGAVQYFDNSGFQAKGQFITTSDNKLRYFDRNSGNQISNSFVRNSKGEWFFFDQNGVAATGARTINGQRLYFKANGVQAKGEFITDGNGRVKYYDANSGNEIRNRFVRNSQGQWFFFDNNGYAVTGARTINGQRLYFKANGVQAKGEFITESKGRVKYYDPQSGIEVRNRYIKTSSGNWYYFGNDGYSLVGWHIVEGKWAYFDENGIYRYNNDYQRGNRNPNRTINRGSTNDFRFRPRYDRFFPGFFRF
ncbi:glycoside hydrolase family 70 protein [Streptococcus macacae]|uniref:dextransucrase n=2 Tax=Streptococcus macacae TaxID=1339 RepID=G5JU89_9STRE|nr:glycoside hydrolase family 70 protein [Streptococcus macacae]AGC00449.1 glucosyltransferase-SI [Streptococcus macacae]EHJ52706.1 glucosyltransferase S [Streptococcus macacae NCTC 11558]SUN78453.1 glucosyltransferase-SI [Streptococcus macacae NCTC 11558]